MGIGPAFLKVTGSPTQLYKCEVGCFENVSL
jgi:hypothetical protein